MNKEQRSELWWSGVWVGCAWAYFWVALVTTVRLTEVIDVRPESWVSVASYGACVAAFVLFSVLSWRRAHQ